MEQRTGNIQVSIVKFYGMMTKPKRWFYVFCAVETPTVIGECPLLSMIPFPHVTPMNKSNCSIWHLQHACTVGQFNKEYPHPPNFPNFHQAHQPYPMLNVIMALGQIRNCYHATQRYAVCIMWVCATFLQYCGLIPFICRLRLTYNINFSFILGED